MFGYEDELQAEIKALKKEVSLLQQTAGTDRKTYSGRIKTDESELFDVLVEVLEESVRGIEWYTDSCPEFASGSDNEFLERAEKNTLESQEYTNRKKQRSYMEGPCSIELEIEDEDF